MQNLLKTVKDGNEITKTVGDILQSIIDITNLKNAEEIKGQLTSVIGKLKPIVAAKSMTSTKVDAPDTMQQLQLPSSSSGNYANEKFKVIVTLERLKQAEQRQDAIFQQMLEQQDKMKTLMVKIAQLDMKEISFEQIIELLREAILLLGDIRVQWG
ncbi:unnamed protein product, partial [Rotaria sp. Silwood1]